MSTALPRRHEIDALRSIALLLLIVYHVFNAYQPFAPRVMLIGPSRTLDDAWFLAELVNPWRIPLLYLLSGITAGYLLPGRSVGNLLESRMLRLVPPFVFAYFLIAPLSPALFQIHAGAEPYYAPNPGQLWFVQNLIAYFVFGTPLLLFLKRHPENGLLSWLRRISPWGWLFLFPAVLLTVAWFLEPHITPKEFAVHFKRFWYGFACFLSGIALVSLGDVFWRGIRRVCHLALPIALGIWLARTSGLGFGDDFAAMSARTVESSSAMLALLGYGSLLFSRPSRSFAVLNRSAFAVYIIHMPVQQSVAFFLFRLDPNPWLAFPVHLAATLFLCALVYAMVLRPVRWLHPFFGIPSPKSGAPGHGKGTAFPFLRRSLPFHAGRLVILYAITPTLVFMTFIEQIDFPDQESPVNENRNHPPDRNTPDHRKNPGGKSVKTISGSTRNAPNDGP
jgi:peptidoglycan/LPS O-acetylase OafA/YrhL